VRSEARGQRSEGGLAPGSELALVCFALPEEAKPFRKQLRERPTVRVLVTGMGRRNTERALTAELMETKLARVFTCGFAGGLDPALTLNEVLFETTDAMLAARLSAAGLRAARFHCASRMAVTAADKAALRRETGADAVEMESAYIHRLCREHGIPCATVRVISDAAGENMPLDFNQFTTTGMKIHFGRLALALGKSPTKITGLLRLQRQTAAAARALADALARLTG
jgi:adenosylhomocysteine nucleosidase